MAILLNLVKLAATCNFTETSSEIKSQLIAGSINDKITRKGPSHSEINLGRDVVSSHYPYAPLIIIPLASNMWTP